MLIYMQGTEFKCSRNIRCSDAHYAKKKQQSKTPLKSEVSNYILSKIFLAFFHHY